VTSASFVRKRREAPTPACIRGWPDARIVTTDVNPESIPATVPPITERDVLTWVGSPAPSRKPP
jgi:hypothetical protein